jgi:elongation factor P
MLNYNEILPKKQIVIDGEPFEVLGAHVFRKQQRKPVNQTKLKNLRTGKVTERSFHQSETAEEAEIERREALYLYNHRDEWWFCDPSDKSQRFPLPDSLIGEPGRFLAPNSPVTIISFRGEPLGISLPVKVDLRVREAPPPIRGNSAQGATKQVVLETGAVITAPIFVAAGDTVRVNTETGAYVERVEKKYGAT